MEVSKQMGICVTNRNQKVHRKLKLQNNEKQLLKKKMPVPVMPVILGTREEIRKIVVPRPDRRRTGGSL
jgi:hypothetical protein